MPDLFDHLERHFGQIVHGWTKNVAGDPQPFQVVACDGGAVVGATVFSTLGLSRFPLRSTVSSKMIRHELFIAVPSEGRPAGVAAILQQLGSEAIRSGNAFRRGQTIGPRGPLFGGTTTAFYVAPALQYPDTAAVHVDENGDRIVIARLIPITTSEVDHVCDKGWTAFESMLDKADPDLLDLNRKSVV